jgi:hypothetical protein
MTTWAQLLQLTLKDSGVLGVGQSALPEDTADTALRCNMMLGQWRRRRWLVYHLVDISCNCDGSLFYEVGPGLDLDVTRPDKIEGAYSRQLNVPNLPVNYPLRIISSYEEYVRISTPTLQASPPVAIFYDSGYPTGKAYPWPLPGNGYTLHILVKDTLDSVPADLDQEVNLPPEYQDAIYLSLMERNRMAYQLPPDPILGGNAKGARETLRSSNFQIATLGMPRGAANRSPANYIIQSDQFI